MLVLASAADGWLDAERLSLRVVVLVRARDSLNALTVDIVHSDDILGQVVIVVVVVLDNAVRADVVSVHSGHDRLQECLVMIDVSDDSLDVVVVEIDDAVLRSELDVLVRRASWRDGQVAAARSVDWWKWRQVVLVVLGGSWSGQADAARATRVACRRWNDARASRRISHMGGWDT